MATVLDEDDGYWGDMTNIYVTFKLYLASDPDTPVDMFGPVMVVPTNVAGVGVAAVEVANFPVGEYVVVVSILSEHNDYYEGPDSEGVTLTIYEPRRGKAMGVGWVRDSDGNTGFFHFYVKYNHRGALRGYAYYSLRVDNLVYFLKTTDITGFTIEGNHAFFEAICTIYQINLDTCEKVELGDYRIRIDVWDVKRRCRSDIFQMRVYDKNGMVVYEVGFDPDNEVIWSKIWVKNCRWRRR
jgi:hypothetical protein